MDFHHEIKEKRSFPKGDGRFFVCGNLLKNSVLCFMVKKIKK